MTTITLSDLFMESEGAPVEFHGKEVHAIYRLDNLAAEQALKVEFLRLSPDRPQCLRVKALYGMMKVNEIEGNDYTLWSDSAPSLVHIGLNPVPGKRMAIKFWNGWRDMLGTTQAWIGNAGMSVRKESGNIFVVGCSDGFNGPTFSDLVVELSIVDA